MAILKKSEILKASDIKTELVPVPEWGGEVIVSGLTGAEKDEYDATIFDASNGKSSFDRRNLHAKLCAIAMRDENGRRMFDEDEVDELGQKSFEALQRVFDVAQRLSGLGPNAVEKLEKNSESGPSAASGSD